MKIKKTFLISMTVTPFEVGSQEKQDKACPTAQIKYCKESIKLKKCFEEHFCYHSDGLQLLMTRKRVTLKTVEIVFFVVSNHKGGSSVD